MIIRFLLVCEGSSDTALVSHIRSLLIHQGVKEADGTASYEGRTLADKIGRGLQLYDTVDLLFVHRDADNDRDTAAGGPQARYDEISEGTRSAGYHGASVPIVPVRMTEAWLLVDASAIRRIAGQPNGRQPLNLSRVSQLERIANPKETLKNALLTAGNPKGRRRKKDFLKDLGSLRRQLLETLPVGGPLEQLQSWTRFRDDTAVALKQISG